MAISVAAHAALIALALWRLDDCHEPAPREVPAPVVIEVVPATPPEPEPEPIAVVVLDDEAIAAALPVEPPVPAPVAVDPRTRERAAITTTAPRASEAAATTTTTTPGTDGATRNPLLTMRGAGRPDPATIDLRLRPGFRDPLEHAPAGTTPAAPVESTGKLQPAGGGTYRSDEGVFTARVDRDGSVAIKDAKNFRVSMKVPTPRHVGRAVGQWYESDKGPDGKRGARTLEDKVTGSIDGEDRSQAVIVPVVGGGFDVTDALLRRKKQDPYFSKKLAYLDSTRDERVAIGSKYRKEQLAKAVQLMQKHVDGVWARTPDPAARKQALFELWDDCAETGEPAVVEAGAAARAFVLGVIRSRFPAGRADAYTAAELATLNGRRKSRVAFAPY